MNDHVGFRPTARGGAPRRLAAHLGVELLEVDLDLGLVGPGDGDPAHGRAELFGAPQLDPEPVDVELVRVVLALDDEAGDRGVEIVGDPFGLARRGRNQYDLSVDDARLRARPSARTRRTSPPSSCVMEI